MSRIRADSPRRGPEESGRLSRADGPLRPSPKQKRIIIALAVATVIASLISLAMLWLATRDGGLDANTRADLVLIPLVFLLLGMGSLILSRRPGHHIGYAMCIWALLGSVTMIADAYVLLGVHKGPNSVPCMEYAAWLQAWLWVPIVLPVLTLFFLYFPDGKLPGPRWRLAVWLDVAILACLVFGHAFIPGPFADQPEVENPLGLSPAVEMLRWIGYLGIPVSILVSVSGTFARFRHSTPLVRQQLKLLAFAGVANGLIFALSLVISVNGIDERLGFDVWPVTVIFMFASVPVLSGLAILRYRLYDIDRVINRTLAFGLVTSLLAATYFGLVVGLQALFRPFFGTSDAAIAVTTLIVATMFLPAQRRIQALVDRRFNRKSYDAARTLDVFSTRLRDAVDLDTLRFDLIGVVQETMQPSSVSVWLRRT